ncbi:MAG: PQQ-dependent sugar dehydrogenase [Acidimicrobiia bacterium]
MTGACSDDGTSDGSSQPTGPSTSRPSSPKTDEGAASPKTDEGAADLDAVSVQLTPVADLESATSVATRRDDDGLWVTEQGGLLRVVRGGQVETVLDLTDRVNAASNEQGLLGLAFSPDGARLYLYFTRREDGDNEIVEYQMRGDAVDESSARSIMVVEQPQPNHNGGQLAFGPDRMLYISHGDGGAAGDAGPGHVEGGNAQSLGTLLGKILRIEPTPAAGAPYSVPADNPFVDGPDGARPEIWSFGLRNPWRFSFDAETGDLWIGDVGQGTIEEIDFAPASDGSGAGWNFGWNDLEGSQPFSGDEPAADAVPPIFEYDRNEGGCSVTGGYVYRGRAIPKLQGAYLFSDFCDGRIRALVQEDGVVVAERDLGVEAQEVTTFGEGPDKELYVVSRGDGLLRIDPA